MSFTGYIVQEQTHGQPILPSMAPTEAQAMILFLRAMAIEVPVGMGDFALRDLFASKTKGHARVVIFRGEIV